MLGDKDNKKTPPKKDEKDDLLSMLGDKDEESSNDSKELKEKPGKDNKNDLMDQLNNMDSSESSEKKSKNKGGNKDDAPKDDKDDLLSKLDGNSSDEESGSKENKIKDKKTGSVVEENSGDSESDSTDNLRSIVKNLKQNSNRMPREKSPEPESSEEGDTGVHTNVDTYVDTNPTPEAPKEENIFFHGGGKEDVFQFFKRIQDLRKNTPEDQEEPINVFETVDNSGLVTSFGISEDCNIAGLKRRKRDFIIRGNKKARYEMQDTNFCSCPLMENIALFCVFDGHLGSNCARTLQEIFPYHFKEYITSKYPNGEYPEDLSNLWNDVYHDIDQKLLKFEDEGSTSTTIAIWKTPSGKKYIQCANVGDSTSFLYRKGNPYPLSIDHKVTTKEEHQRIKDMGIDLYNDRIMNGLNVTRSFGDFFWKNTKHRIN